MLIQGRRSLYKIITLRHHLCLAFLGFQDSVWMHLINHKATSLHYSLHRGVLFTLIFERMSLFDLSLFYRLTMKHNKVSKLKGAPVYTVFQTHVLKLKTSTSHILGILETH